MKKAAGICLFFGMLCKRFLKNKIFIMLLLAIPVFLLFLKEVSGQDSGLLHIAICVEDIEEDTVRWLEERLGSEGILCYQTVTDRKMAEKLLDSGAVDEVWVFAEDFRERVDGIVERGTFDVLPAEVVTRENTVVSQLARFHLFAALYPDVSYAVYRKYVYGELGLTMLTEEEIRAYYESGTANGIFVRHVYEETVKREKNYVTAPFRGLFSLLILLAGLAADMFFLQDLERGVLDSTPLGKRQGKLYLYQLAAMLPVAVAVIAALLVTGEMQGSFHEIMAILLYLAANTVFCSLLLRLCGNTCRLGILIPVLMLGMFVLCPVFFTLRKVRTLQYLFPPFYYLMAVQGEQTGGYLGMMAVYVAVGVLLNQLLYKKTIKGLKIFL